MATIEQKKKLIKTIKNPVRYFRLNFSRYGGEVAMGTITKDQWEYWSDNDESRSLLSVLGCFLFRERFNGLCCQAMMLEVVLSIDIFRIRVFGCTRTRFHINSRSEETPVGWLS